ncbi:MAG: hypothetical protein QOE43_1364 [Gaiellaceae bacterium]|nr:hypothetical protein [Gaiellaceae bacterium]
MKRLLVLGCSIAALAAALAAGASAFDNTIPFTPGNPVVNGCAAGFEAIRLADFPSEYKVPAIVDSSANGGNGDGIVCGKPFTPQEQAARLPNAPVLIFSFADNTLTPAH